MKLLLIPLVLGLLTFFFLQPFAQADHFPMFQFAIRVLIVTILYGCVTFVGHWLYKYAEL